MVFLELFFLHKIPETLKPGKIIIITKIPEIPYLSKIEG